MNYSVKKHVERLLRLEDLPKDAHEMKIREVVGDLMVYCRDHDIQFYKVIIDAVLERME